MTTNKPESFCLLHLADIHIRDVARERFHLALARLSAYICAIPSERMVISVIVGDIFHYKTRLSAENIADCYSLLDCLAQRSRDIVVIPGNHDANLNNEERMDLLSPILDNCRALPHGCAIHYWSQSGWQDIIRGCFQFYVFSPLSRAIAPANAPACASVRIALIHDFVDGLKIQGSTTRGAIKQEWLSQFTCVMCGHSHDYQSFKLASGAELVYSGALTQLTIGESFDKGFVVWDFAPGRTISHQFVYLDIPGALVKYVVAAHSGASIRATCNRAVRREIPCAAARVVIEIRTGVPSDCAEVRALVNGVRKIAPRAPIEFVTIVDDVAGAIAQSMSTNSSARAQKDLIETKLRASNPQIDAPTVRAVLAMHAETTRAALGATTGAATNGSATSGATKWSLMLLEWDDLFCYTRDNYINFANVGGLAGLIAPNRCGKSSIIDILALALFNRTLRGSAISIIRKGQREGSLRCIWESIGEDNKPTRHEVARKWDLKGHTTIQYFVDSRNCTSEDLKTTYAVIEKSVGTLDDFLSTVLIPQHTATSFLEATDQQRRAMIARVLGLDLLDDALSRVKDREREHQAAIKTLSALIESAIGRIAAHSGTVRANLLAENANAVEADYQAQIKKARDYVNGIKEKLDALEAQPAVAKPARTRADIDREIRASSARLARLDCEFAETDARLAATRAKLALLLADAPYAKNLTMDSLDADRAKIAQLSSRVDQQMLLLGRAKGIRLEDVPARFAAETSVLSVLLEIREIITELATMPAAIATTIARADDPHTLDEARARKSALAPINGALPRECTCESATPENAQDRIAHLEALQRELFAPGVAIPREIPVGDTECIARIRAHLSAIEREPAHAPRYELAYCAIQMVRGGTRARDDVSARYERARQCCANHDAIRANNEARESRTHLEAICTQMLTARLHAAVTASGISKLAKVSVPSAKMIGDLIFAQERALALLGELRDNIARIREAQTIDAQITELRGRVDACFAIQRVTLAIDSDTVALATIKENVASARASQEALRAQLEPAKCAQDDYDAFLARKTEIKSARDLHARSQAAYLSLIAEMNEYARVRDDLADANARIAKEHSANHICQLYRATLDTKTGIQYSLMTNAIHLIEEEANRILSPIAGLSLSISLGAARAAMRADTLENVACGAHVPSNIAKSSGSKTMSITVRNSASGMEHAAELCSGFQRFILNIALRRAFLRAAVRPVPRFMIIDEGFGCLDDANMIRLCEYLPELARELRFMLIVSHIDSLNTMITTPLVIDVNAGANGVSAIHFGKKVVHAVATPSPGVVASQRVVARRTKKSERERVVIDPAIVDKRADGTLFCKICGSDFADWIRHARTKKHTKRVATQVAERGK